MKTRVGEGKIQRPPSDPKGKPWGGNPLGIKKCKGGGVRRIERVEDRVPSIVNIGCPNNRAK